MAQAAVRGPGVSWSLRLVCSMTGPMATVRPVHHVPLQDVYDDDDVPSVHV